MEGGRRKGVSYLFRYGLLTPAIFGVSHLMYRTHALKNPNTATIKHILAELVRFSFRRLVIYAPVKRKYLAVSNLRPIRLCLRLRPWWLHSRQTVSLSRDLQVANKNTCYRSFSKMAAENSSKSKLKTYTSTIKKHLHFSGPAKFQYFRCNIVI